MRINLISLLILLGFVHVFAIGHAQKVSFKASTSSAERLFSEIRKQTGYSVLYSGLRLKHVQLSNIDFQNVSLKEVLDQVAQTQGWDYEVEDKTIILKPRKVSHMPARRAVDIQVPIQGVVKDTLGNTISGATVRIKGQPGSGVSSNAQGTFSIAAAEGAVLQISMIGYLSQEITVGADRKLEIMLQSDLLDVEEIVVLGFGQTQKKIAQTGSTASISNKELMQSPVSNITNALAGRLPGLIAIQRSGEPGRDKSDLYIRGVATLNSAAPLVTIDGVQKEYSAITTLDPNEIENITILKDASATALYGVKGANGVIIVTTRRGKEGKATITGRTQTAIQSPTRIPEFLDSYGFATLYNEAYKNDNPTSSTIPYPDDVLEAYRTGSDPLKYPNVDWAKELLTNSLSSQTNFSLSGGNTKARYFVNMGYMYQDGIYKTEPNELYNNNFEMKRYNFRSNVDIDFDEDLSLALNLYGAIEDRNYPRVSAGVMFGSIISRIPPNAFPIRYPTGFWGIHPTGYSSPHALINSSGFTQEFNSSLSGMASLTRKLNFITTGLSIKGNFSFDGYFKNNFSRSMNVRKAVYLGTGDYNDPTNYSYRDQDLPLGAPTASYGQNRDTWLDLSLNYNRSFGKHNFIGLLLANRQQHILGGQIPFVSQGLVGRIAYNYQNELFAELNAGYSGTDNFAREHRYGFFPAVSVGWVAIQNHPMINLLKFRASHGISGNDQLTVTNRRWLFIEEYMAGTGYSFGETLANIPGVVEGPLANPLVSWETAYRSNVGFELNLFGSRLFNATIDLFYEKRNDMLVLPQSIPYMSGVPSDNLPPANFGKTENKGFEVEVKHAHKVGAVNYFVNLNTSFARNKILEMDEETRAYPNLIRTGQRIGQEFGLKAIGFFENEEDIINSRQQTFGRVIPGDLKYYDANGDGIIDNNDVMPIGKSTIPEMMYGLSGGVDYKGFDVSFLLQGASGFTYTRELETAYEFYNGGKVMKSHLGRWTPETAAIATYPVLHADFNDNNHRKSSFFVRKGDYLRLKNVEIGYTFRNVNLFDKKRLNNIRLYANGMNLFTWDKTEGDFDPESPGGRYWTYPQVQIFNFGLSTNF
ncbi:TonB-dependent receptor [Sphingobacterium sp. SGG-5]|uniref:TonB-dependent receptor n=1 Tax=Sphingobacterium sp. SGG-5 TaxID=2710881 RepID=UPI0013E9C88F|nr:TonB-dependent receptor [Sphingobacterium sp. SGG-5]NGM60641.1 TonB-dependent receptor [Sphingobacterium sp. SGG-5]